MDAEVIPDSDQLSSMYPVFVATVIIAVATARAPQGKYRSFLVDLRNMEDAFLVKVWHEKTFTFVQQTDSLANTKALKQYTDHREYVKLE